MKRLVAAQGTRKARRCIIRRDPMDDSRNFTFDEIVVGHSETLTRQLSVTEIEALALAAGAIDPTHIEGARIKDGPTAPGAAAAALVSNLLLRRFPGPGSTIVETRLHYGGAIGVGDKLTVTISAISRTRRWSKELLSSRRRRNRLPIQTSRHRRSCYAAMTASRRSCAAARRCRRSAAPLSIRAIAIRCSAPLKPRSER